MAAKLAHQQQVAMDLSWRESARCRGMDTDIFFEPERGDKIFMEIDLWDSEDSLPEQHSRQWLADYRRRKARSICRECEVRTECAVYALITKQRYGMFGGLTAKERKVILRNRRPHRVA